MLLCLDLRSCRSGLEQPCFLIAAQVGEEGHLEVGRYVLPAWLIHLGKSSEWCGNCMPCVGRLAFFFFIWVVLLLCCGEGGRLSGTTGSPVGSLVPALRVPVLLVGRSSGLGMHLLTVLLLWEAIA